MSTTSLVISADQSGTAYTAALNNALAAINSCHSGSTAPTNDLVSGKFWLDTSGTNPVLKIYNGGWRAFLTIKPSTVDLSAGIITASSSITGNSLVSTTTVTGTSATFSETVTAADFNTTSDARLKDDIKTIAHAVETVNNLRGVSYSMQSQKKIGVIAQEVEAVLPEVVYTDMDGYKSVAYGNIVGLLIEAVKEQTTTINSLLSRLEVLEKGK